VSRARSNVGWIVWLQWITATGIGWAFGEAAASFISEDSVLLGTVHTAVSGVVLGMSQWLVLRSRIEMAGRWIVATAIGSGLGGAVGFAASFASGASVIQPWALLPLGVALGVCQWLILRSQLARAGWWILAYALGLPVSFVVGLLVSFALGFEWEGVDAVFRVVSLGFFGMVTGAVFGAISGALLIALLRNGGTYPSRITTGPHSALRRAHE
jgi:hypothetical protein